MLYIVKEHGTEPEKFVLSIIDKDLLGKIVEEGNKILDLTSDFYKGEIKTEEEVLSLLKKVDHINVVGKNIITLLKKENIIETTLEINGVPYAQTAFVKS